MKFLIALTLIFIPACTPLHTNSPMIKDIKKNIEIQSENIIKLSNNFDKVAEKIGLDIPSLTPELKDALKQLQADNDKKYELINAQMADILKTLAKIGLGAAGVPPVVTNAGLTAMDAVMGVGGIGAVAKIGLDMYARRRKDQQHKEELEEAEVEKEKIRLRLEREKQELKEKSMIKERTMAKLNPNYQAEWDKCNTEARNELRSQGRIS